MDCKSPDNTNIICVKRIQILLSTYNRHITNIFLNTQYLDLVQRYIEMIHKYISEFIWFKNSYNI